MSNTNITPFSLKNKRIWIAGHNGMVGSAIMRRLAQEDCQLITVSRSEVDLTRQSEVETWLEDNRPDAIFLAAAKVGGILANTTYPAEFLYNNLMIEANIIQAANNNGVEKLLFLGSSCIYPRNAPQPMPEDALLTGSLEQTNQWYALAKIAGIKLCQAYRKQYNCNFIAAMPCNLYGYNDNFELSTSHVLPALMAKFHHAKIKNSSEVEIWGSGKVRREFLFVDDLADALVHLMKNYSDAKPVNIGTGSDITILELANLMAQTISFKGSFTFDPSKPDGVPQKLLETSVINNLGWQAQTPLQDGISKTYKWYVKQGDVLLSGCD